ncbi:MAG: DegT/DnrJ/EryC1/StrS family aminotransferase [Anaerolineae bacterium]|nr:DegT/DnrJ/EryC1/StrS family aminotransferase [Anaerolineae bacterium]
MIEKNRRKEILARGKPAVKWPGEPKLGSYYGEEEIEAIVQSIRESMDWTVGFSFACSQIPEFEAAFAAYCGTTDAIAVNGAGTGIDMAIRALELEPGDEVICPAINFKAVPLSIIGHGGKVVFGEIDPRTFQLDPNDVERKITPRTRAILPTHMNGLSAPMDDYIAIAERHPHAKYGPLKVIGDAARACGGSYKDTKIGKKGWVTIFSFHTQKNMTTLGEGGAITTDDESVARTLRGYRHFGWGTDGWGTNYKMTKVQAVAGLVQLKRLDGLIAKRLEVAHERTALLADMPELILPYEPPDCVHTFYLYTILVPPDWAGEKRDRILQIMETDYNISCVIANPPVSESTPLIRAHTADQHLPLSDELGQRLFCPPIHPMMTRAQNEYLSAALIDTVERIRENE